MDGFAKGVVITIANAAHRGLHPRFGLGLILFRLPYPFSERLARTADLCRDRVNRLPLRVVVTRMLQHYPDCSRTDSLRGESARTLILQRIGRLLHLICDKLFLVLIKGLVFPVTVSCRVKRRTHCH